MKTIIVILINIILSAFYIPASTGTANVIVAVGLILWNIILLALYAKRVISDDIITILLSSISACVWLDQPMGIAYAFTPIPVVLLSDTAGIIRSDLKTKKIRFPVLIYASGMYGIKVALFKVTWTEIVLCCAITLVVVMFAEFYKQTNAKLQRDLKQKTIEANYDQLTKLGNRTQLQYLIKRITKSIDVFSVIIIDVDKFKGINDTYGHDAGDDVLKELAASIKSETRDTDTGIRYGGDEFLVICQKTTTTGAINLAERIRVNFCSKEFNFTDQRTEETAHGLHFSISLGVSECRYGEFTSIEDLIGKADQALYDSKESGRNRVSAFTEGTKEVK